MKRLTQFVVITMLLITILSTGALAQKTYKIGAAPYGLSGEFMRLWTTALERHPAVQSGLVQLTVFDGRYDASVQHSQFETMVTQGFDGILFVPIDIEAGAAAVDVAHAAGIPVVGSNTRVNSDKLLAYIGSDDVLGGEMQAEGVAEMLGYKGNVVILEGPIGQSAQIERRKGNMIVLDRYPEIKLLAMLPANWSRGEAMDIMDNWLSAYPGQIDGVIAQNDEMALGAIEAIRAAGIDVKGVPTSGIDGISDAMISVQKGEHDISILQDARGQAEGALDILLRHLIGPEYEPLGQLWERYEDLDWADGQLENYNVPWTPITLDNVDELLKEREALTERN